MIDALKALAEKYRGEAQRLRFASRIPRARDILSDCAADLDKVIAQAKPAAVTDATDLDLVSIARTRLELMTRLSEVSFAMDARAVMSNRDDRTAALVQQTMDRVSAAVEKLEAWVLHRITRPIPRDSAPRGDHAELIARLLGNIRKHSKASCAGAICIDCLLREAAAALSEPSR